MSDHLKIRLKKIWINSRILIQKPLTFSWFSWILIWRCLEPNDIFGTGGECREAKLWYVTLIHFPPLNPVSLLLHCGQYCFLNKYCLIYRQANSDPTPRVIRSKLAIEELLVFYGLWQSHSFFISIVPRHSLVLFCSCCEQKYS